MQATCLTKGNTSTKKRVLVGLSGGVDSAVSAALLVEQGFDVVGVFIRISLEGYPCTAEQDKLEAMRVAAHLRIPFMTIDLSDAYKKHVFDLSIEEFAKGRTPNPDALCNREIKFGLFYNWCMQHGAQLVATGHYAQTKDGLLYEGEDTEKDQSYFLWAVPYEVLCNTLFPIGGMRKIQVRSYAKKIGLPNDNRKDSQGLCFLGPVSIDDMLRNELLLSAGMVVNEEGEILGTHEGVEAYTLGQRHGFTLVPHTEDMKPHFVIGKDIVRNTLIVSTERFPTSTKTTRVSLKEVNWIGERSGSDVEARYRYRQKRIPVLYKDDAIVLTEPHYVPLGQSLVIYEGRRCLGGGIVEKSELL